MPRFKKIPEIVTAEQWFPGKEVEGVHIACISGKVPGLEDYHYVETDQVNRYVLSEGDWVVRVDRTDYYCVYHPEHFAVLFEPVIEEPASAPLHTTVDGSDLHVSVSGTAKPASSFATGGIISRPSLPVEPHEPEFKVWPEPGSIESSKRTDSFGDPLRCRNDCKHCQFQSDALQRAVQATSVTAEQLSRPRIKVDTSNPEQRL